MDKGNLTSEQQVKRYCLDSYSVAGVSEHPDGSFVHLNDYERLRETLTCPRLRGKRLYEMTVAELAAAAEDYKRAGNEMWATLCREQIDLNHRIAEAFQRSIRRG